jgi:murein DD-endopeptidase MepM/ murein hydrolase activator NlpD
MQALVKVNPSLIFRFMRNQVTALGDFTQKEFVTGWQVSIQTVLEELKLKILPDYFPQNPNTSLEVVSDIKSKAGSRWALVSGCFFFIMVILFFPARKTVYTSVPTLLVPTFEEKMMTGSIYYTFSKSESLTRVAKYAIARQSAVVPTQRQITEYIHEVAAWHNERNPGQLISGGDWVPAGTTVEFFIPSSISNPEFALHQPAFDYFMSMVDDPFPYITGVWAERGTGGMPRHEGVDVATKMGALVKAPHSGKVYVQDLGQAGRTVCLVMGKHLLLFGHLDRRFVKSGQLVEAGTPLGTVGMTGRTSGPHVHIGYGIASPNGLKIGSKYYKFTDPMLWFYRQSFQKTNT